MNTGPKERPEVLRAAIPGVCVDQLVTLGGRLYGDRVYLPRFRYVDGVEFEATPSWEHMWCQVDGVSVDGQAGYHALRVFSEVYFAVRSQELVGKLSPLRVKGGLMTPGELLGRWASGLRAACAALPGGLCGCRGRSG